MAVTIPAPGVDVRALIVDVTGAAAGSAANPTVVQGSQGTGVAITSNPFLIAIKDAGGLIRIVDAASVTSGPGDNLMGDGVKVFDGANWQPLKGNADGSLPVGGFTPPAPTCTFTRGANTTAYTIGDEVGTAGTAPTTISVGRFNGGSGVIQGAQVVYSSYAAIVPQLVLLLFSATVTLAGDNAQLNLSDAHAKLSIGWIPLTASQSGQYSAGAPVAAGNTIFRGVPTEPLHFVCAGGTQTIFAALITLNAFTPIAVSETLDVTLSVEQN